MNYSRSIVLPFSFSFFGLTDPSLDRDSNYRYTGTCSISLERYRVTESYTLLILLP